MKVEAPRASQSSGLPIVFRNICYTVKRRREKGSPDGASTLTVLNDISGLAKPGRVMVIMGPSGAGKTSLLDILAGRAVPSCGQMALGSKSPCFPVDVQRRAAYVQQDDAIMASQTVREALRMAANLTLPRGTSQAERQQRTDTLLKTFHLEGCADTIVGDPVGRLKGISGGERKRLAVAMGAVREPRLIFLDEPTSGLDSHKAYTLVRVLKQLAAANNSTVVCTLHQPSSDIFALYDDLMLLLDGRCVFNGAAAESVPYFASIGHPCPNFANPADFLFMHVLTSLEEDGCVDEGRSALLASSWAKSELNREAMRRVEDAMGTADASGLPLARADLTASFAVQYATLLQRAFNDVRRNPMRGKAPVFQAVFSALIITVIWWDVGNDQNSVQDRAGVIFFLAANGLMQNVMGVLTTFANERAAVLREQENGMYQTLPYFLARILVDLPLKIVCPVLMGSIGYWTVGLQADGMRFLSCLVTMVLLALSGNAIGLFLACLFSDVALALMVAPMVILPFMMFSGFFLNPESSPVWLLWLEWISPMKYAFSALAQNEFTNLTLYCTDDQMRTVGVVAPVRTDAGMPAADAPPAGQTFQICPIESGEVYLDNLNIQAFLDVPNCQRLLALEAFAFTCLAYFGLEFTSRRARSRSTAATTTGAAGVESSRPERAGPEQIEFHNVSAG